MSRIVVVGSSNTDMVVKTAKIPRPGETVIGGEFVTAAGGKGANQAVAAARLGAQVTFVACVGTDVFGDRAVENLRADGIDTSYIVRDETSPSGVALIFVDEKGENVIVVAPGANARLRPEHVDRARSAIEQADTLVVQLEVPVETVERSLEIAVKAGVRTVLNPAPARQLPESVFAMVDVLTPNETEAATLAGMPPDSNPPELAADLLEKGVGSVVLTLGSRGALIVKPGRQVEIPASKVTPVDTTAAGDAFTGGLAAALAEGETLDDAARFASSVAAISVTRMGAQPSMPTRREVERFISEPHH